MAFVDNILATEWGPARDRTDLIRARADLDRQFHRAQELAVSVAKPDPAVVRHAADVKLVEDAIAHHVTEGLRLAPVTSRPVEGDLFPAVRFSQAQWHATRAQLLLSAPVTVAAAALREEALAALDTNPTTT